MRASIAPLALLLLASIACDEAVPVGDGTSVLAAVDEALPAPRLLLSQLDRIDSASSLLIERWPYRLVQVERAGLERLASLEEAAHEAQHVDLEPATLRRLEALGHVGGAPDRDTNDETGGKTR